MKKTLSTITRLRMAAVMATLLLGAGTLAAQTTVSITPVDTDYEAGTVQFSVSWTGTPVPAGKVWVWIDYCPIAGVTPGTYGPASITAVSGGVDAASLNGRGFWVTANPATVTATLASPPAQFSWCAHGSGYAPQAVPRAGGGYDLKGTPPFTVNGTPLGAGVTTFGAGTCITSVTDLTGNPEGILPALPAAPTGASANAICGDGNITFSATPPANCTIDWYGATGNRVSTGSTTHSAYLNASATFYAEARDTRTGCVSASRLAVTGTVNPLPTATSLSASTAAICVGASVTLTATATGAASYSFDNVATWQAAATKLVSPTSTTTYTLTVRSAAGCLSTDSKTVTISVNPLPTTTSLSASSTTICYGPSVTLTAAGSTNTAYYRVNDGAWNTAATQTVTPTTTTTYTLKVRSAAGCESSDSKAVTITVNALPTVTTTSPAARCGTGPVTLTATAGGGTTSAMSYTWGGTVAQTTTTANSYLISGAAASGTYSVTLKNSNNCTSSVATGSITVYSQPAAPTGASANVRCGEGSLIFSATVPSDVVIDWYPAASGGTMVDRGVGYTTRTVTTSTTYYAETRVSSNGCVSASRLAVAGTVVAIPSVPTLSNNGPKCYGTGITFTAAGGSGTYDWNGEFSGAGTTKTSSTYGGAKTAAVRSVVTASGTTCYSSYSANSAGTVVDIPLQPAAPTSNGPKCAGTGITFTTATVPSGATGIEWTGSVSGTGTVLTKTTGTTAGTYSAAVRSYLTSAGTTCYSAYSAYTPATITATPSTPAAPTQNGPTCAGTQITFTAAIPSGATGLEWTGSTSGSGTVLTKTTATTAGTYNARVRSYLTSAGTTCYSPYSATATGIIIAQPAQMAPPNSSGSTCESNPITFTSTVPNGATGIVWSGDVSGSGTVTTKTTASGTGTYSAYVKAYTKSGTLTCYGTISNAAWGYVRPTGNNGDINTYGCCNTAYWFANVCTTQSWTHSDACGNEVRSFHTIGDENDALAWHEAKALTNLISHYSLTYTTNKIYDLNLQSGPYRSTSTECSSSPANKSPCTIAEWKSWACTK